jgi:hypothetical protein
VNGWVLIVLGLVWGAIGAALLILQKQITDPLGWSLEWTVIGWMGVSLVLVNLARFAKSRRRRLKGNRPDG